MKKIWISLIIIIPMTWAGLTWLASNKTEDLFNNNIKQSTGISDYISSHQPTSFQKGFFKSTATSSLTMDIKVETPFQVPLNHDIYHGPIMLTPNGLKFGSAYILTTLDIAQLSPKDQTEINAIFNNETPFSLGSTTSLDSNIDITLQISPLQIDDTTTSSESPFFLSLDGYEVEGTTNSDGTMFHGVIKTGKFIIGGLQEDFSLEMHPSTTRFNVTDLYQGMILNGLLEGHVSEFHVLKNTNQILTLKNLTFGSKTKEKDKYWVSDISFQSDQILFSDPALAKIFSEASVNFYNTGYTKGINIQQYKKLLENIEQVDESNSPMVQLDRLIKEITNAGVTLLMEINTPQGSSIIKLALDSQLHSIQNITNFSEHMATPEGMKKFIKTLKGDLSVQLDKSIVSESGLEIILTSPPANQFLNESETAFTGKAFLDRGELTVNDQTIPLLDMLGLNTP
ncbi:MAG: YdgA family protein [Thiomicrorhabdus sp.]|nr:YdgA family protein [Thiomicrorhabdus sp.]